jgi:hypothetical protein
VWRFILEPSPHFDYMSPRSRASRISASYFLNDFGRILDFVDDEGRIYRVRSAEAGDRAVRLPPASRQRLDRRRRGARRPSRTGCRHDVQNTPAAGFDGGVGTARLADGWPTVAVQGTARRRQPAQRNGCRWRCVLGSRQPRKVNDTYGTTQATAC